MKQTIYLPIVALLLLTACEKDPVNMSIRKSKSAKTAKIDMTTYYNSLEVEDYLNEYANLFGNDVQVFTSEQEADALLDEWSEMDYATLRQAYNERHFKNLLIEASIKWDSVYTTMEEKYGDEVMQHFPEQMLTQFPELVLQYTTTPSDNTDTNQTHIEPISDGWDLQSLTNSKGIVIIDKIVYQYKDNYLLTTPIDQFVGYATSTIALEETNHVLSQISQSNPSTYAAIIDNYTQTRFEVANNNRKILLTLGAEGRWAWFNDTNHRGTVRIRNYTYKNGKWVETRLKSIVTVRFHTTADYMPTTMPYCLFSWKDGGRIDANIKDKVYKQTHPASQTNSHKLPVKIYHVYINAQTDNTVKINYGIL